MPISQRPPETHLQTAPLGLFLAAVRETVPHRRLYLVRNSEKGISRRITWEKDTYNTWGQFWHV